MIERTGNPLFYLDSMIFIYAVEEDAIHGPAARELLTYFQRRTGTAVTSELSLAEVLAPNKRRGVIPLKLRQAYIDLIVSDGRIVLESISRSILFETADLRAVTGMKLPDAIHIATATQTACQFVVTNDSRMSVPTGMARVEPTESGIVRVVEALA